MRNETLTHNIRLYSAQNFSFPFMQSGILTMLSVNKLYARGHIMSFTFSFFVYDIFVYTLHFCA